MNKARYIFIGCLIGAFLGGWSIAEILLGGSKLWVLGAMPLILVLVGALLLAWMRLGNQG